VGVIDILNSKLDGAGLAERTSSAARSTFEFQLKIAVQQEITEQEKAWQPSSCFLFYFKSTFHFQFDPVAS
jgi:hypothetical protein